MDGNISIIGINKNIYSFSVPLPIEYQMHYGKINIWTPAFTNQH